MARKIIDLDTVQPNGKRGETQRPAFTKVNENFAEVYDALGSVTTIVDTVSELKNEIEQDVARAKADVQAAIGTIPAAVDLAINGRIPGRNRLINGNFDFWQRGITGSTAGGEVYVADRWAGAALGCTHQVNRGANLPDGGAQPESTRFWNSIVSGTTSTSSAYVAQKVEGVTTLSGTAATLSGFVYGSSGTKIGARLIQHFGTGGSPSAPVSIELGTVDVRPDRWTYFQFTVQLPSVKNKTLGSNAGSHFLWVVIDLCADGYGGAIRGQNGNFGLAMVQLEAGSKATGFELRPLGMELDLCQRYFNKSYPLDIAPGTANDAGRIGIGFQQGATPSFCAYPIRFPVSMRATPTVTIYSAVSGVAGKVTQNDNSDVNVVALRNPASSGAELNWNNSTNNFGAWFHYTADAEIY
ncbi:hypothetical protein [Stenotrophomonas sp. 24(2023)]|uniref:hypothetical protein n=1 Tax=Stenotrophomonas sp. 24(2023) TaxID=3068324 RepID=UPI0027DF5AF7|nr:hypothetical protein [Stenotrophomonas sp. 24(2023)]WMJ71316.1 hypothetical protein Q9R17_09540 [Stenotrophomonas sp. 24(2023)]